MGESNWIEMNDLDRNRCIRCGRCMSVCPVYQTTFREADVARGRLALLESTQEGDIKYSRRLEEILSRCLLCGACAEYCASQVDATRIIQQGRHALFMAGKGHRAVSPLIKSARKGHFSGRLILKGGALLQGLLCKKIPETSGLHLRFPLSFFTERAVIPALARTSFLKASGDLTYKGLGPRVGFFVGCGANYLFPEISWTLVRLLEQAGATVIIPREQVCCGLPAYVSGDTDTARTLAKKNIDCFKSLDLDAVLTVCASCGSHMSHLDTLFENDPVWRDRARLVAEKHKDAIVFLVEDLGLAASLQARTASNAVHGRPFHRVTYHDPCHLRISQGVTEAPRRLIEALPGADYVEAPHSGHCCGHGGDFNLSHFDLSMDILDRRMKDLCKAKPHTIVTGCTGCLLQVGEGVNRKGLEGKVRVCHPLVLADEALQTQK